MSIKTSAMEAISLDESALLMSLEKIVESDIKAFVRAGLALEEIRLKRLYRSEFKTFQEYCQKKWNFSKSRAYQLIDSASLVQSLPLKSQQRVDTEAAARRVAAEQKRLARNGETITPRQISKAAKGPPRRKREENPPPRPQKPEQNPDPSPAAPSAPDPHVGGNLILTPAEPESNGEFTPVGFRKFLESLDPKEAEKFADIATQFGEGVTDRTGPVLLAQFVKALLQLEARIPEGDEKHYKKYADALIAVATRLVNKTEKKGWAYGR